MSTHSSFSSFRRAAGRELSNALPTAIILAYHRVTPDLEPDPWSMKVDLATFREHLRILEKHRVVSLRDVLEPSEVKRRIAITFDDGYEDNLLWAAPALLDFGMSATFFVVAGDPREVFWWDRLSRSGQVDRHRDLLLAEPKERQQTLTEITLGDRPQQSARMSEDQIRELSSLQGMEIGAHTMTHPLLSRLGTDQVRYELSAAKERLEQILEEPVTSLAYPHGSPPGDLAQVKQAGFERACTVLQDRAWKYSDPYLLPRFNMEAWTVSEFEQRLESWLW